MTQRLAIGIDVGGTKIAFALAAETGEVVARHQLPTLPDEGADAVLDRIAAGIHRLLDEASALVVGIGIGCPGQIDPAGGMVYYAVNLRWRNVDLRGGVERRLRQPLPVWIQKDANAGVLVEVIYGAARGSRDVVYVAVGTGLGGGAVIDGRVITGVTFNPTEIGHLSLNPDGRLCNCGLHGCAEIYVSGMGFLAGVREHRGAFPDSPLARLDAPTTAEILQAAHAGDALALTVVREGGQALGAVIAACAGILNPALIVVGGGLGHAAASFLLPEAERELRRRTLPATYEGVPVVLSQVTDSALGAAALVWHFIPTP